MKYRMTDAPSSILVIDDSAADLETISIVCKSLGCEVDVVSDGFEAMQIYESRQHQFVITDYVMEPVNGIYLVSRIREMNPDAICLLITGFPDGAVRRFSEEAEVEIVMKPFKAEDLKEKIRLVLNRSKGASERIEGVALSNRMDACRALAGDHESIAMLRGQISRRLNSKKALLLVGPEATQLQEVAVMLHECGPSGGRAYVYLDCRDLSESAAYLNLIAEDGTRRATLREATGGTLILDHILKMPKSIQSVFAKHFDSIAADMRIIALSEEALEEALGRGEIDDEFYFRLTEDIIEIPWTEMET